MRERETLPEAELLRGAGLDIFGATNGACLSLPGRCEHVSCRHHLEADLTRPRYRDGRRQNRLPIVNDDPCALRVAHAGPMTLDMISALLGCTRERVRQIEVGALDVFRHEARCDGFTAADLVDSPDLVAGRRRRRRRRVEV